MKNKEIEKALRAAITGKKPRVDYRKYNGRTTKQIDAITKASKPHRWKPGQSGNPGGRVKGMGIKQISNAYGKLLEQPCTALGLEDLTWAEAIARGIAIMAVQGEVSAAREIRETTEGKTPDRLELGGMKDAGAIPVEVTEIDDRLRSILGHSVTVGEAVASAKAGNASDAGAAGRTAKDK